MTNREEGKSDLILGGGEVEVNGDRDTRRRSGFIHRPIWIPV